jgi:hypothetical protein
MTTLARTYVSLSDLTRFSDSVDEALAAVTVPLGDDFDRYVHVPDGDAFAIYYVPTDAALAFLTSCGISTSLS